LRELAENPQDIVDAVLREGTPEARAIAKAQEEARLAREEAKVGGETKKTLDKFLAEQAQEKAQAVYDRARDDFLSSYASPALAPALHAQLRSPDAVFRALDATCREWEMDGMKRGIDFDESNLVAYLEKGSREWLQQLGFSLAAPAQPSGAGAPAAKGPGLAPKSAANGTRTITAASSSERRASPKPFNELSAAEQREDLIRVAQEAYRQHGQS